MVPSLVTIKPLFTKWLLHSLQGKLLAVLPTDQFPSRDDAERRAKQLFPREWKRGATLTGA